MQIADALLVATDRPIDPIERSSLFDGWMFFIPTTSATPSFYDAVANATREHYRFNNASTVTISPCVPMGDARPMQRPHLRRNRAHLCLLSACAARVLPSIHPPRTQVRSEPLRRNHALRVRRGAAASRQPLVRAAQVSPKPWTPKR